MAFIGTEKSITPRSFLVSTQGMITKAVTIASTAVDASSSPTSLLQPGLLLGKITASGFYAQYADSASDGTQTAAGILMDWVDLKAGDPAGSAHTAEATMLVAGHVDDSQIITAASDTTNLYITDLAAGAGKEVAIVFHNIQTP